MAPLLTATGDIEEKAGAGFGGGRWELLRGYKDLNKQPCMPAVMALIERLGNPKPDEADDARGLGLHTHLADALSDKDLPANARLLILQVGLLQVLRV